MHCHFKGEIPVWLINIQPCPVNIFHLRHPSMFYPPKYPQRQLALLFEAITARSSCMNRVVKASLHISALAQNV